MAEGRRLIVNADDLGLHPSINAGIVAAHRDGVVTSASLCAGGAAFEDAITRLRQAPRLGVGVHLTLVAERPVSPPARLPTLAPHGRLPRHFTTLFRRLLLGRIREHEIEAELVAQVERVADAGVRVTHLDGHQHVHLHPRLLPLVLRVARRFSVPAIRAARRVTPWSAVRPAMLSPFARRGARLVRAAGFKTPDTCLGLESTGRLDEPRLLALARRLGVGTSELVCHPGSDDAAIAQRYDWGFRWQRELDALTSPRVREALGERAIALVDYGAL